MRRALWPVLIAAGIGLSILLSLGVWQVQRLAEKQALIAEIDRRMAADPMPLEQALALPNVEAVKVLTTGQFAPTQALKKIAVLRGGPGFDILSAFVTSDGKQILVLRGIAGEGQPTDAPPGEVTLHGILRIHDKGQGRFDPNNNAAANQWNWWDIAAMHDASGLSQPLKPGLILQLLPKSTGTETLEVDLPKVSLRNNHLGYAITWFGLAAVLAVMAGVFLWRLSKEQLAAS